MTANVKIRRPRRGASLLRSAATGATVLSLVFALCWLGAVAGLNGVHTYIALFTAAPIASSAALFAGLCLSIPLGALIGAATAASFRAFAFLDRVHQA